MEASATQDAINQLPRELSRTVEEFYLGRGGITDKARRLCCGESTVYARVELAHHKLASIFSDKNSRAREERARVEALQRGGVGQQGGFTA
jgi:hypothetical protein